VPHPVSNRISTPRTRLEYMSHPPGRLLQRAMVAPACASHSTTAPSAEPDAKTGAISASGGDR